MPMQLSDRGRPFVHARRLTNVGEILKGEKKRRAGSRKQKQRPKRPAVADTNDPMARLAWNLYESRRRNYLNDINHRVRELTGGY